MRIITKNKFVFSNYEVDSQRDVGIVLKGHEVKSIKTSNINISEAIVKVINRELWISNMDVPLYAKASRQHINNYDPKGMRKLLITKKELTKIVAKTTKTGYVIIPIQLRENKKRLIKLTIGVAKLLKKVQKKQIIKEKDQERQMNREIKNIRFV